MKRFSFLIVCLFIMMCSNAQSLYWVYFTDKANTTFDPYSYFDAKAIERRIQNGISLYDISDYPLNDEYVNTVAAYSEEMVGETRWLNAVAVVTTEIEAIRQLPFVKDVAAIYSDATPAQIGEIDDKTPEDDGSKELSEQLQCMQGKYFIQNHIDGKGKRIAVLDGGFPKVDTHPAFQHLRNNHQIIKTYNFPNKKEDVYGWSSHGTMVLSCIAGIRDGELLGLATGAEFLLARTEVNMEPAREEVWWLQGMEWADQNGADIINSSLGYGKDRYHVDDMDGKKSVVSQAANMAADKGILVCNSMGNEGDDPSWRTLITPADADKILSVGGIAADGRPSYFTSVGPTADGRLKPNVCAFGTAIVANPMRDALYTSASGTSFSSPLVAGFAACAWQTRPDMTAMQMKALIEQSGNRHPYFDYTYGYGVPQAGFFFGENPAKPETTSPISIESKDSVVMVIVNNVSGEKFLAFHVENQQHILDYYATIEVTPENNRLVLNKKALINKTLRIWYDGYFTKYQVSEEEALAWEKQNLENEDLIVTCGRTVSYRKGTAHHLRAHSVNGKYNIAPYLSWGFVTPPVSKDYGVYYGNSESFAFGMRFKGNICKWYSLGANLEIGATWYGLANFNKQEKYFRQNMRVSSLQLEFYQRFRLCAGTLSGYGIFVDTGIYGGWNFYNRFKAVGHEGKTTIVETTPQVGYIRDFDYGVRLGFGVGIVAVYAKYRISDLIYNPSVAGGNKLPELPKLQVGLQLTLPSGL